MPIYRLTEQNAFPDPELADESGLLAVGGDLSPARLLNAYAHGIFPWYHDGLPILWHSPDPRCVLPVGRLRRTRSLRKSRRRFDVTFDEDFAGVIDACAQTPREGQDGTWITADMREAYLRLHRLGFAHSVEVWAGEALVGGIYGVSLGAAFFGESMFHHRTDASKVALAGLDDRLAGWGFHFLDGQLPTPHLLSLGFEVWPRDRFMAALRAALAVPTRRGRW